VLRAEQLRHNGRSAEIRGAVAEKEIKSAVRKCFQDVEVVGVIPPPYFFAIL